MPSPWPGPSEPFISQVGCVALVPVLELEPRLGAGLVVTGADGDGEVATGGAEPPAGVVDEGALLTGVVLVVTVLAVTASRAVRTWRWW